MQFLKMHKAAVVLCSRAGNLHKPMDINFLKSAMVFSLHSSKTASLILFWYELQALEVLSNNTTRAHRWKFCFR